MALAAAFAGESFVFNGRIGIKCLSCEKGSAKKKFFCSKCEGCFARLCAGTQQALRKLGVEGVTGEPANTGEWAQVRDLVRTELGISSAVESNDRVMAVAASKQLVIESGQARIQQQAGAVAHLLGAHLKKIFFNFAKLPVGRFH